MTAQTLDGKAAAAQIKTELAERVAVLRERGVVPGIATVLVGADPASQLYVGMKHRQSEAIGMNSIQVELPADATQAEQIVSLGQADAVFLARAELRDPYWPRHAAKALGVDLPWPVQYQRADVNPLGKA